LKHIAAILFIIVLWFLQSSNDVIKLSGKPEIFTTDKLGNCYIYRDNLLKKISSDAKVLGQFSSLESGKLHSIDASDPMQVILFYKDFNQLILVDNKLSQIGKVFYFDLLDLSSVTAVCKSKQFAIWIFDEYEEKLILYGFNPQGIILTINIDKYKKDIGNVDFMIESGNEIYLKGKNNMIWVFDHYGSLQNKLELPMDNDFQIKNNTIIYSVNNQVVRHNVLNEKSDSMRVENINKFDKIRIESNMIYILNSDSISVLSFES